MRKISRRHKENLTKTKNIVYSNLEEAVSVLKETATPLPRIRRIFPKAPETNWDFKFC